MNSLRSPAPNASMFNLAPKRNNGFLNSAKNMLGNVANLGKTNNAAPNTMAKPSPVVIILIVSLLVLFTFIAVFYRQIQDGVRSTLDKIRILFGGSTPPPPPPMPEQEVTKKPDPPQDNAPADKAKMVEKILPGKKEVFNISKNTYTYYDAEPLCKALGAELATYEQVKQAYAQGADWCNYGWTKGQMAVYPTQQSTWDQLQSGPEEQRNTCGRPGVNGGYFDNPELKYGVNCYGPRPEQKDHDAMAMTSGEGAPLSVAGLEFEKKIAKYRGEANNIAILPWNRQVWSA